MCYVVSVATIYGIHTYSNTGYLRYNNIYTQSVNIDEIEYDNYSADPFLKYNDDDLL